MSKNTLLALVLSLGILMLWSYYINKKRSDQVKIDKNSPVFNGLRKVTPDYKNGYIKLEWDEAEGDSYVNYYIFLNQKSKITRFNNPPYYTRNTSYIISDLDISKNYYFAVKAVDNNNNMDDNKKQIYFKSRFEHLGISEEIIKYENSVGIYYFSTLGARLKNIILKNYKTLDKDEPVHLLYYPGQVNSYYYPLDMKILTDKDDYELLRFNDQTYYTHEVIDNKIIFTGIINNDLKIIKEYRFQEDNYYFDLNIKLNKIPGKKSDYSIIALKWQPTLGPNNLSEFSKKKLDRYDNLVNCYYAGEKLKTVAYKKKNFNKIIIKKLDNMKWVSFHNRYFISAIMPVEKYKIQEAFFYSDGKKSIAGIISSIDNDRLNKQVVEYNYTIYAGPKLRNTFDNVEQLNSLKKTISTRSFPIIGNLSNKLGYIFLDVMLFIYKIVKNYGLAIIIFTILIKIIMYPITHKQFSSMVKMQKLQPVINQVKEQYKSDARMMNKELMKVYKKHKVNPFGGCLPLLLQMPIFFAIWNMLQSAIELRTASFLWIKSLALPDTVGYFMSFPINILPIFMGATMMIQQMMTGTESKQKSVMYFMPLIFLVFFWNMPSGLVLYWSIQNVLSIGQQFIIKKRQNIGG